MTASANPSVNPWAFQAHPEVWLLIGSIVALGWYAVRRIGPLVAPSGTVVVTRSQKRYFAAGVILLWIAADWPIHDIAEEYLYSMHTFQHMLVAFVVPPLMLLAMPEWLARLLVLDAGRVSRVLRVLTRPVIAGVLFNAFLVLTYWGAVVRLSTENGPFHYLVHIGLFFTAMLMWFAVLGPLKELHLSEPGKLIYLFSMSIVPTVPAGWLAMAEGVIYDSYDNGTNLWGLGPTTDQQLAGVVMKVVGGFYLWTLIAIRYFRFASGKRERDIEARTNRSRMTYADVERAFDEAGEAPRETRSG